MTDVKTPDVTPPANGHLWEVVSLVALCAALGAIVFVYVRQSRELTDRVTNVWDRVVPVANGKSNYGEASSGTVSAFGEASESAGDVG
jgi:hypothetical protein